MILFYESVYKLFKCTLKPETDFLFKHSIYRDLLKLFANLVLNKMQTQILSAHSVSHLTHSVFTEYLTYIYASHLVIFFF